MASYDFTFVRRCQVILSLSGVPVFCEGPRYKIEDHTSGNLGPEEVPGIGELRSTGLYHSLAEPTETAHHGLDVQPTRW